MGISFEGQVVVVTGGGGGLGRAQAIDLGRRGAAVVVNDPAGLDHPDGPAADAVVAELEAAGARAVASHHDVGSPEGGRALVELAVERFGTVDAIVHYAGTWRHVLFEDMTTEMLDPVLDVHLRGAVFVTQPAWPIMQAKGYGRVVLVSSAAGVFGRRWGANYAAAKGGLMGLGRALALEGAEHGILTNCLLPVSSPGGKKYDTTPVPAGLLAEYAHSGTSGSALPPGATNELVTAMPTYLASDACTVNGEAFAAGAGQYARVFSAVTDGWICSAGEVPEAEDVVTHLDEIRDLGDFTVPVSVQDQLRSIMEALAARDAT